MPKSFFFPAVFASIFILSCQKEISSDQVAVPPGTGITGTYKFISVHVKGEVRNSVADGNNIVTVTNTEYTSTNNKGTVIIDATTITSKDLSYDISTTMKGTMFENGALIQEFDAPFEFQVPASSGSAAYKLVGADSIYLPNGSFVSMAGSTNQSEPGGMKFKVIGKQLILSTSVNQVVTDTDQGVSASTATKASLVTTLEKQ